MRKLLFIFIAFAYLGCSCKTKGNHKANVLPVMATLTDINCTWFESPELNQKARIADNMKTVFLYFTLSNPNDYPVYIPVHGDFRDSIYSSNIEVYLKGIKLETIKKRDGPSQILGKKGKRYFKIKIWDIRDADIYKGLENIRIVIPDLEFKYIKYDSDSIYHKMKVGDMKFIINKKLIIKYRDPETVNDRIDYI